LPKIDSIKEKINILRDDYRNLFIFFMAVITSSFTVFYQVLVERLDLVYIIIGIAGIIISLFVLAKMKKLKIDIDELITALEELE
jgi:hypothetical protein